MKQEKAPPDLVRMIAYYLATQTFSEGVARDMYIMQLRAEAIRKYIESGELISRDAR